MYGENAYIQHNVIVSKDKVLVITDRETTNIDHGLNETIELVYFVLKFREDEIKKKIEWHEKLINEAVKFLSEPYVMYSECEANEEAKRIERKLKDIKYHEEIIEEYRIVLNFLKKIRRYIGKYED